MGGFAFADLKRYRDKIGKSLSPVEVNKALKSTTLELGGRLLRDAVKLTPTGKVNGGTLKRGWRASGVSKTGEGHIITVTNDTEYAVYVEYGHRTRTKKDGTRGFAPGRFMLTRASRGIDKIKDEVVRAKIDKLLRGGFK